MLRLFLLLLTLFILPTASPAQSVLADLESGQTILAGAPNEPADASDMLPLMSVYAALETLQQDSSKRKLFNPVQNPWGGADIPLADLLKGLLMTGDQAALEALPGALGLATEDFSRIVRDAADQLGMKSSEFSYPCGRCVSTAADIALLASELYERHAVARLWGAEHSFELPDGKMLRTTNSFLERSPAITGIYVAPERQSAAILSENPKGTDERLRRLLAVSLESSTPEALREEISSLLLRGYRDYETLKIYSAGDFVASIPIYKGAAPEVRAAVPQTVFVTMTTEQMLTAGSGALEIRVQYASPIIAPIKAGERVGTLRIYADMKLAQEVPLTAQADVDEGGFWTRFKDTVRLALSQSPLHHKRYKDD